MKKSISLLFAALMCVCALFAENTRIYCKMTQSWWTADGAAVGAHYWNTSSSTTYPGVRMTQVVGEAGLWYIDLDITQYSNIIFTRINGSGDVKDWGAKTQNLTIPTDGKNLFTIETSTASWGDPGCTGTWSTYTPSVETPTYYITGNDKLVGTAKAWLADAIELGKATAEAPATYTFTNLAAGDTMRLKVTNGTWDFHYGYTAIDKTCSSENIQTDKNGNIVFVLTAQGDVKLTFDGTNICLTGSFASATPVQNVMAYYINTNNWATVNAYVFGDELIYTPWPGKAMTKTELQKSGFDVYSYEFPSTCTSIIFNNGTDQTADLTFDATKPYYLPTDGKWYASLEEIGDIVVCTDDYGVMVGEEYTAAVINPENAAEYMVLNLNLKQGDTFTMYNNCAKAAWVITNFKENSYKFTVENDKYVVTETGKYDLYFELKPADAGGDAIYVGFTSTTPTDNISVTSPAADAPAYNLLGVRVDGNYRGIVIRNGKKFIQQ